LFERTIANVTVYGFLPVVPMVLGSAVLMIIVSLATRPPSQATIDKYFGQPTGKRDHQPELGAVSGQPAAV
jgi:hypothetical protein